MRRMKRQREKMEVWKNDLLSSLYFFLQFCSSTSLFLFTSLSITLLLHLFPFLSSSLCIALCIHHSASVPRFEFFLSLYFISTPSHSQPLSRSLFLPLHFFSVCLSISPSLFLPPNGENATFFAKRCDKGSWKKQS